MEHYFPMHYLFDLSTCNSPIIYSSFYNNICIAIITWTWSYHWRFNFSLTEYRPLDKSFTSTHFCVTRFDTVESFNNLNILKCFIFIIHFSICLLFHLFFLVNNYFFKISCICIKFHNFIIAWLSYCVCYFI